jgi:LDH2 family malate/lactate/ureidoglycolate dehydrogenase
MSESELVCVDHEDLLRFSVDCFRAAGFDEDRAVFLADRLVEADLCGLNTHGVIRLPMYLNRVKAGLIDPRAEPRLIHEKDNIAIIDGSNGMGQVSSHLAMNVAIRKAGASAVAAVGVRNSNHFGPAAHYTLTAAERQMIGISMSNTEPLMPAPGGAEAVVGNNPFSVAIPVRNRPPIVLDMATSVAALGKMMLAQKKGESIPAGWGVDRQGKDTTNPSDVLQGGFMLPVGGPKGYGISLIIDILAGILSGSGFGKGVACPFKDMKNEQRVGHFFIVIDVQSFLPLEEFYSHLEKLVNEIRGGARAAGVDEVFLPGEIEWRTKQARLKAGVPLPVELIRQLEAFAVELGVSSPKIKPIPQIRSNA